jgi:hypothetical protein
MFVAQAIFFIRVLIEPNDLRFMKTTFIGIGAYKTGTCDHKVIGSSPVDSRF